MKRGVVIFLLLAFSLPTLAQKVKRVSGEYIYVIPETESYEQAKISAVSRAKIQILADTFGTVLEMSSSTTMSDGGARVQGLSNSQVKGEWIETIGEPRITRLFQDNQLAIKVEIAGKVREITSATTEFAAKALRNVPDIRFESTSFNSGDDLFLYFKAPEDGFLVVYLYDGNDHVFCLLPYERQSDGVFKARGNRQYVFFSEDIDDGITPFNLIDEYTLTASADMEMNRIYVIFSPHRFTKALDSATTETTLPRELSFTSFQKWLSRIQTEDKTVGVRAIDITIYGI